jgi:8-oxo-dGTP pyrophosphatase MutT (NUDIX family)
MVSTDAVKSITLEDIAAALSVPRKGWDLSGRVPSAVAVPLASTERGIELWAIRRPEEMRQHAGEIAFPGGKADPDDPTLLDTALREMEEELDVPRDKARLLGAMTPVPVATSRFAIHPFAVAIDPSVVPAPRASEVAELIRAPLGAFFTGEIGYAQVDMKTYVSPIFRFGERIMYGASAHILLELLESCATLTHTPLPAPLPYEKAPWLP